MAAFSDLCDLVLQSSDCDSHRRHEIQQALGYHSNLLVNAISNLSPLLDKNGHQEPTQMGHFNTTNASARTEFRVACQRFLHAMTCDRHPLVLFIDDIQWMDDGSRQLIKALLHDAELMNVVLIFAYREEENDAIGDLFSRDSESILDIVVNNLNARYVYQLVSGLLDSSSSQVAALSDLVVSKTAGNPFHVIQFIETIQNEGLLGFDEQTSTWAFDVCEINSEMMVSETLCDLLSRRIGRLEVAMQQVLKIASLIGFSFPTSILFRVTSLELLDMQQLPSEQPRLSHTDTVQSVLSRASAEGFIEITKDGYQFSHDKLQDAFQSMVDHADKQRLHYLIGDQYVLHGQTDNDDSHFQAAVHLNKSGDYALRKECREKLARINLAAARRCRDKSAFIDAVLFLRHGLKLLDEAADDMWTKCFDLAFELTENLAKMELIVGNLDTCKQINEELARPQYVGSDENHPAGARRGGKDGWK
jgi:predicted ATPase